MDKAGNIYCSIFIGPSITGFTTFDFLSKGRRLVEHGKVEVRRAFSSKVVMKKMFECSGFWARPCSVIAAKIFVECDLLDALRFGTTPSVVISAGVIVAYTGGTTACYVISTKVFVDIVFRMLCVLGLHPVLLFPLAFL